MSHITLLLHNIRSSHNVGAILRTADGFGVNNVICSGYTPYPIQAHDTRLPHIRDKVHAQIEKTALGATKSVSTHYIEDLHVWLTMNTLPLVALEQSPKSVILSAFESPEEFCLVLGEEVHGIEPWLLKRCQSIIEIPMHGAKESFNVSVATGIALYALTT